YHLPELLAADPAKSVFIAEGEKDVDNLRNHRVVATTNAGGAGKWKPSYNEFFRDRHVVILQDNDDAGQQHAEAVADSLRGTAASVRVLLLPELPPKGDVSDWLSDGGT